MRILPGPRAPPTSARQVWLRNLPGLVILVLVGALVAARPSEGSWIFLSLLPWAAVWLGLTWVWARRVSRGVDARAWRWRALAEVLVIVGSVSVVLSVVVVWRSGWPPWAYALVLLPLPMLGLGMWGLRRFPAPG